MMIFLFNGMVALIIPMTLFLISTMTSMNSYKDREKMSPFECGFSPDHSARIPFSLRFFLLAVIFLVFDIEVVLLLPMPMLLFSTSSTSMLIFSLILIFILLFGLLHEWREGSLDWAI